MSARPSSPADPEPTLDADALIASPSAVGAELGSGSPALFDPARFAARVRRWSGIFAAFFTAQALVQAAGLAAGLLFVRYLPVGEFAVYTLASSVLVTLAFVTDLGSSSALLHFFHRSRTEGIDFEPHAAAVVSLRRRLFAIGAPLAVGALALWGTERGFDSQTLALSALLILAATWLQISSTLAIVRLRLEDRYPESYRAEIAGALARLALAALLIFAGLRTSTPALATAVVAVAITALLARGGNVRGTVAAAEVAGGRRAVMRYLAPMLPGAVYFAIQGQFVVWLAAAFGGTTNVAQVGALGRIGLLMGLFGGLISIVFLPRLMRLADEGLFRRRCLQFGALLFLIAAAVISFAALAPRLFLFILGPTYAGLDRELLLVLAAAGISLVGGYAVAVNNARSWTRWQPAAVALLIACQVGLAFALPLGTTVGVLLFGLGSTIAGSLAQFVIAALGFVRPRWVAW